MDLGVKHVVVGAVGAGKVSQEEPKGEVDQRLNPEES